MALKFSDYLELDFLVCFVRSDTDAEISLVIQLAKEAGAYDAVECTHWADGGTCININPLHPNITIYILHTVLYTFPKVLTRRICLTIKSFISWGSFPLFS